MRLNFDFNNLRWVLIILILGVGALFVALDVPLYLLAAIIIVTLSYTYKSFKNLW